MDGICDAEDNCPGGDDIADADNDGICDAYDKCPGFDDAQDDDDDGIPNGCDNDCRCELIPIENIYTVGVSSNDVEQFIDNGMMEFSSGDLDIGADSSEPDDLIAVGLRYQGVYIPSNAIIQEAYIQFSADEISTSSSLFSIQLENNNKSIAFENEINNLTNRPFVSSAISWSSVPAWNVIDEAGVNQRSPDISFLLSNLINNQPSLNELYSLTFMITGSGDRTANSFDADNIGAKLFVSYAVDCDDLDGDLVPLVCDTCPDLNNSSIGQSCDDGNDCTTGELYDSNCNCTGGVVQDIDGDGVCDSEDVCDGFDDNLIGQGCDDGDDCTAGEIYDNSCNCTGGIFQDIDEDGVCDVEDVCNGIDDNVIGQACNDGDDCTTGEIYDNSCNCTGGVFQDADEDGVCDFDDVCNGFDDNLIGQVCDDGDDCTIGEIFDDSCNCTGGEILDIDNNGICDELERECEIVFNDDFETNDGIWQPGGGDAERIMSGFSPSGNYSMRIRDNSLEESAITSVIQDFTGLDYAELSFDFIANGMEDDKDFFFEISIDGGSTFFIFKEWVSSQEFVNNELYSISFAIDQQWLSEQTIFRFRCDGTINSDEVYLDNIQISYCQTTCVDNVLQTNNQTVDKSENASFSIESNGIVGSNEIIEFSAGAYILLTQGFEVRSNASFHAFIEGCE